LTPDQISMFFDIGNLAATIIVLSLMLKQNKEVIELLSPFVKDIVDKALEANNKRHEDMNHLVLKLINKQLNFPEENEGDDDDNYGWG
jgi:hypothetical protein